MSRSSVRGLRVIKAIQEYVKSYTNQFDTTSVLAKVKILDISDQHARAKFTVEPQMCNLMQTVHGGYMSSVIDALCVVHLLGCQNGKLAWTTNMNVHFLNPASVGEKVTVESTPVKVSSGAILMEAKATNDVTGQIVATGTASFIYGHDKFQKIGQNVLKYLDDTTLRIAAKAFKTWERIIKADKKLRKRLSLFELGIKLGSHHLARFYKDNKKKMKLLRQQNFLSKPSNECPAERKLFKLKRGAEDIVVHAKRFKLL